MSKTHDAIIIGTGQAGPSLAARLAQSGMKVAVIERARFGGTCVNYGCIPTKTMVASAKVAHMTRRGPEYGVLSGGPTTIDMRQVKARKDEIVRQSTEGVEQWLRSLDNLDVIQGHATFESSHTVRVGSVSLSADRIFINVGTRAFLPPIPGLDLVPALTNADMLDLDFVPPHLVVVGGSYIGLEFGQMFRRFGSDVTIVEKRSRLVSREDPDVAESIGNILEEEGVTIRTDAECIAAEPDGEGVRVTLDCGDDPRVVSGSHLLVATGRQPNTHGLGLENTGIRVDTRGYIQVNDHLMTSAEGVYALGDVNGRGTFTHTAYNDHEIVADNLLNGADRKVSDRIPAYALYIDPPFARVGLSETEVAASGRKALLARRDMSRVARAKEKGETQGFMKAMVDTETERILGFTIVGVEGDEVVHSVLDVMYADAPYTVIQRAVHIHPTVSELIPTLLGDLEPMPAREARP